MLGDLEGRPLTFGERLTCEAIKNEALFELGGNDAFNDTSFLQGGDGQRQFPGRRRVEEPAARTVIIRRSGRQELLYAALHGHRRLETACNQGIINV